MPSAKAFSAPLSLTGAGPAEWPSPGKAFGKQPAASAEPLYPTTTRRPASASLVHMAEPMPATPPDAQVGLFLVGREVFDGAQPRAVIAHQGRRFVGQHALVSARLDEFAHPQSTGVARRFHGGQRVVGADDLVAVGHVGAMPQ